MTEKCIFSEIAQVGVIVRDMDKAIKYYESLGIGPFKRLKPRAYVLRKVRGNPVDPRSDSVKQRLTIACAQMGPIQLELIEPGEKAFHWREFLETHGEGINHLGFFVDDIEKEQAKLIKNGFDVLYESRIEGGGATYLSTDKIGGVLMELIQKPAGGF
jgi:methylmalonyl-CoA/ethylmalonyl-CoA epimerase